MVDRATYPSGAVVTLAVDIELGFPARRGSPGFALVARFAARPGITALWGPSGAGKTSVLNAIAGLVRPRSGRIELAGQALFDATFGIDLPLPRRQVGYVLQDLALFPHMSALANVAYGLAHVPRDERRERALAMLERFGLKKLETRRPHELSGGQRQRVALARTLVTDPRVLLLDEPFTALDDDTKLSIMHDLKAVTGERLPVLLVSHDRADVGLLAARTLKVEAGLVADGERPSLKVVNASG